MFAGLQLVLSTLLALCPNFWRWMAQPPTNMVVGCDTTVSHDIRNFHRPHPFTMLSAVRWMAPTRIAFNINRLQILSGYHFRWLRHIIIRATWKTIWTHTNFPQWAQVELQTDGNLGLVLDVVDSTRGPMISKVTWWWGGDWWFFNDGDPFFWIYLTKLWW